ncbi:hypothetical protein VPNG_07042 [Cytospora leucostoma]|uniref:Uncharacterized protein n=1 Tax=Cytospora leucostoma TaxID=1230097 RepID=A0A423WN86_9PEZI|nr:hypothetical protein VPNG_07042 [Cytospora leucostoma]
MTMYKHVRIGNGQGAIYDIPVQNETFWGIHPPYRPRVSSRESESFTASSGIPPDNANPHATLPRRQARYTPLKVSEMSLVLFPYTLRTSPPSLLSRLLPPEAVSPQRPLLRLLTIPSRLLQSLVPVKVPPVRMARRPTSQAVAN